MQPPRTRGLPARPGAAWRIVEQQITVPTFPRSSPGRLQGPEPKRRQDRSPSRTWPRTRALVARPGRLERGFRQQYHRQRDDLRSPGATTGRDLFTIESPAPTTWTRERPSVREFCAAGRAGPSQARPGPQRDAPFACPIRPTPACDRDRPADGGLHRARPAGARGGSKSSRAASRAMWRASRWISTR